MRIEEPTDIPWRKKLTSRILFGTIVVMLTLAIFSYRSIDSGVTLLDSTDTFIVRVEETEASRQEEVSEQSVPSLRRHIFVTTPASDVTMGAPNSYTTSRTDNSNVSLTSEEREEMGSTMTELPTTPTPVSTPASAVASSSSLTTSAPTIPFATTTAHVTEGLPVNHGKTCKHVFVTAFWDMGSFRDSRNRYVETAKQLANALTSTGCTFVFFCGGHIWGERNDDCEDFRKAIGDNENIFFRYLPMTDAYGDVGLTKSDVNNLLDSMHRHPVGGSIITGKYPKSKLIPYFSINHAKFSVLLRASEMVEGRCADDRSCLIWVDAGIYRHSNSIRGFTSKYIRPVLSSTCAVSASGTNWPTRERSIYLAGARDEIAAGVLTFDSVWYKTTFFPKYKELVASLKTEGYITSDQGMLTLLAQQLTFTILRPSYDRIMERMLNNGPR